MIKYVRRMWCAVRARKCNCSTCDCGAITCEGR